MYVQIAIESKNYHHVYMNESKEIKRFKDYIAGEGGGESPCGT